MQKIWILAAACALAACAQVQTLAEDEVQGFLPTPLTVDGKKVTLTDKRPSSDCRLKGGIVGDVNPDVSNRFLSLVELTPNMKADLRNNAAQMGGNTVWVRATDWYDTQVSVDYPDPFVVNNVRYGALVYWCAEP